MTKADPNQPTSPEEKARSNAQYGVMAEGAAQKFNVKPGENVIAFLRVARCSFCYRPQSAVGWLVAGETAAICAECVSECLRAISANMVAKKDGDDG